MTISNRNVMELSEISEGITDLPELIVKLNEQVVELNFILAQLTFRNLDGQIKTIEIPAGSTLKIGHVLKTVPAHRVILRQEGGGVIRDGSFTKDHIELINDGGSTAKLTIIVSKG